MKRLTNYFATFVVALIVNATTAVAGNYDDCYRDLPISVKMAEEPVIPELRVRVTDYGAVGDGVTLTTEAIQKAIDDVAQRGGGHVVVPSGIWLITSLELKSNIDLHLERNALLQQTPDKSQYKQGTRNRFLPCIHGNDLHDISVTGEGAVDGCGKYWRPVKRMKMSDVEWKAYLEMGGELQENGTLWMPYNLKAVGNVTDNATSEEALRSDLFRPERCNRVMVKGVSFQNSPRFTVHPCECTNVIIDGVSALSPWNVQNADGIDLSNCRQCLVVNSYVDCGDDGLCLKSGIGAEGVRKGPCKDILIQDCRVRHAHGGFVMGSDVAGGMENIVVRRCMFTNTDIGLRFKSAIGRGGTTRNVKIYDIVMTDIANEAIVFNCGYFDARYSAASADKQQSTKNVAPAADLYAPDFQDMDISRVTCREAKTAIKASGIEGLNCVHGIRISNSTFFYRNQPTEIDEKTAKVKLENVKIVTF